MYENTIKIMKNKKNPTDNIFGAYIMNTRIISGKKSSVKDKEREQELFEVIDDYIEQA